MWECFCFLYTRSGIDSKRGSGCEPLKSVYNSVTTFSVAVVFLKGVGFDRGYQKVKKAKIKGCTTSFTRLGRCRGGGKEGVGVFLEILKVELFIWTLEKV